MDLNRYKTIERANYTSNIFLEEFLCSRRWVKVMSRILEHLFTVIYASRGERRQKNAAICHVMPQIGP